MKKGISALLCIVLCLCMVIPALATNSEGVTFSATLSTDTLNVSDTAQSVTLKIAGTPSFTTCAFGYVINYPAGWIPTNVTSDDLTGRNEMSFDDDVNVDADNHSLKLGWLQSGMNNVEGVSDLGTFTFTVPANADAGSYTFTVTEFDVLRNISEKWESGSTLTATLTIKGGDVESTGAKLDKTEASVGVGGSITLSSPTLLPTNTTATITKVEWASADETIATVDNDGKVTGVKAGQVNITATVTTSDSKTHTAVCAVNVTQSPYTVSVKRSGSSVVHAGDTVTMNVTVSGKNVQTFTGLEATITYDTGLFTYVSASNVASASNDEAGISVTTTGNSVRFNYSGNPIATGTIATLTFTAKNPSGNSVDGDFKFSYAKASNDESATKPGGTGPSATEGDTVTVTKQVTVTFYEQDGTKIQDYLVDAGGKLTTVPTATADEYHEFDKWLVGTTPYSADDILDMSFTDDTNFTAKLKAKSYTVTLAEGLSGDTTATYGEEYEVTINNYNAVYNYTVTYTIGDVEKKATDAGNGKFTIAGANITGNMSIDFRKNVNASVSVHENYVTGYTLITVSSDGTAYSFDGNAMYYLSDHDECAWLIYGPISESEASALVDTADAHAATLADTHDLNGDGLVDIDDAVIVNAVLNHRYALNAKYMKFYLMANLSSYTGYKVNSEDVNAILTDSNYVK